MKRITVFIIAILGVVYTSPGFSQDVYTMNCPASPDKCKVIQGIEGRWAYDFFGLDTLIITRTMNTCYNIRLANDKDFNYRGRFIKEDGMLLLVLSNLEDLDPSKYLYAPAHTLFKLDLEGDTLRMYGLNHEWFEKKIQEGSFDLDYFTSLGNIYITAPLENCLTFLLESRDDPGFFAGLSDGVRVK